MIMLAVSEFQIGFILSYTNAHVIVGCEYLQWSFIQIKVPSNVQLQLELESQYQSYYVPQSPTTCICTHVHVPPTVYSSSQMCNNSHHCHNIIHLMCQYSKSIIISIGRWNTRPSINPI